MITVDITENNRHINWSQQHLNLLVNLSIAV